MKKGKPILAMRRAIEAMIRGDFTPSIPTGDDSLGHFGKSLKKLSSHLQKQFDRNQSLYRIMVECNLNLCLIDVLNHIYESFQCHLPYDRLSLALIENDKNKLNFDWVRADYRKLELNVGESFPIMNSSLQELIESHAILVIDDLSSYLKNVQSPIY